MSTKFLGVVIDDRLNWNVQIENVCKKVSKGIGLLYSARQYLNKNLLKQLYHAFVHCHVTYCNIAWASTNKTKLETLFRRQKHALRVINQKDRMAHTDPLFKEMKILNIFALNVFQTLCLMYKCREQQGPPVFHDVFKIKSHGKYSMRTSQKTVVQPFSFRNYELFSFRYRGPRLWNQIVAKSNDLLASKRIFSFKTNFKKLLSTRSDFSSFF